MPERLHSKVSGMKRRHKQLLMGLVDISLLVFSGWGAYALRFGEIFTPNLRQVLLIATAPVIALPIFIRLGLYRSVIRYMSEYALWSIVKAMTLASILWTILAFFTEMTGYGGLPRSVPILYWMLGLIFIGGSRIIARWALWIPLRSRFNGHQVLIYGAGLAGQQLAATLRQGKELFPAGFLDDDQRIHGTDVAGLRVYSPSMLPKLIERFEIRDVIVTLPSASGLRRREVVSFLEQHMIRVRILPALTDIASGRLLVNMVREVDVGDLLGRDPVVADPGLLGKCITGKSVLVTGAGGSIGSELCRQIASLSPRRLVLLESCEHALYQIDRIVRLSTDAEIVSCLGTVEDLRLVSSLLSKYKVQTVYHAAAHKHVPLVEANIVEGIHNNIVGTNTIASAAFKAGVSTFVLISTDKAVRPTNVMGATKRWAELIVQNFAQMAQQLGTDQRFCAVRFGNVLGSSGSVIPLFKEQISQGGPVTVTHSEVTRYFMSIHEAVELVIQAGSMANGGDIFLLDMGDPVKIADLARNMIHLAGRTVRDQYNPEGDIEIVVTGLRPGEKLYEELLISSANGCGTDHPKIMRANEPYPTAEELTSLLSQLHKMIDQLDSDKAKELVMSVATQDRYTEIAWPVQAAKYQRSA